MSDEQHTTKIVDIDMPFGSMVQFMIKWALAAIPAMIIVALTIGSLLGALGALSGRT